MKEAFYLLKLVGLCCCLLCCDCLDPFDWSDANVLPEWQDFYSAILSIAAPYLYSQDKNGKSCSSLVYPVCYFVFCFFCFYKLFTKLSPLLLSLLN